MRILLPPSETKRPGGGSMFAADSLSHDRVLRKTRARVRRALLELCRDEDAAAKSLKLGVKNRGEILHNRALRRPGSVPAMPAIERYTGVLYDALEVPGLDDAARRWIDAHVLVQSALFGLVAAGDPIPAYRLSASSRLPGLEAPLGTVWREAHARLDWEPFGWILDLRSQDYAALAPLPEGAGAYLHVVQRGADGEMRALNHFNKTAKGELVRMLAQHAPELGSAAEFVEWAAAVGLEASIEPETGELVLVSIGNHQTDGRLK